MLPLAVWTVALAGIVWQPDSIPGLWVGEVQRLTGTPITNFRHADLDGDGHGDLILPTMALLQRGGRFPIEARAAIPLIEDHPLADIWENMLYLLLPDRLVRCAWQSGQLREAESFAAEWPAAFVSAEFDEIDHGRNAVLRHRRFLTDINADGIPEVIAPYEDGLVVYAMAGQTLAEAGQLAIFPPTRIVAPPAQHLWPWTTREISFPTRQMSCLYAWEAGAVLTVEQRAEESDVASTFSVVRHHVAMDDALHARVERSEPIAEVRVPRWVQPCRLNNDGNVDFAGGRTVYSETSALALPLFETFVRTGAEETAQTFHSRFKQPHCLFTDVNNDGRLDMIAEHTQLFEGGMQETIARAMTSRRIDHAIVVHLQNESGTFSAKGDMGVELTIQLAAPAYRAGPMMTRYGKGQLVNLTGDFNGDGLRDLAVQESMERIAIWLNTGERFIRQTESISVQRRAGFAIVDIDGDGLSDVVFTNDAEDANAAADVLYTREGQS